jgi:hypothetical protein
MVQGNEQKRVQIEMKKIYTIPILFLCLAILAIPVIAEKEGLGIHAGITIAAAENSGQSYNESGGPGAVEDNRTSARPAPDVSRGDQPGGHDNNRNVSADVPRNLSQIPKLNQSREHGAGQLNASAFPPGWEKNKNDVRDAVHSLLAMENRTGGIGPQVSANAREFDNSVNASQQYEDRIKNRDSFSRFFFGGDRQAAAELGNLTAQNQARISEIENLMNTTTMDADTLSQMNQQLQVLQQQLAQEQQLIAQAQQDHGLFGWF